jgi:UDP-N-acetylmuramate--alanine ligase
MADKHYHFIGIGGIGMSGIAHLFLRRGFKVSGSDLKKTEITDGLKKAGAFIYFGHHAANILGACVIVYSSAIKKDNPEIIAAKKAGLPLLKRAQALAGLMRDRTGITIAGSHGKTTTTSLLSYLLLEAGLSPTIAIGGILKNIDTNVSSGTGEFFVAEADESDGSFLYYRPKYSVITNIDREHLDYYKTFRKELAAFAEFIKKTDKDGCIFACSDDANLKKMLGGYKKRSVLFGLKAGADIYPKNIKIKGLSSTFDCYCRGKLVARFSLALGGRHNISNSLAVIAVGLELRIDPEVIQRALANYKGAGRRIDVKFQDKDYLIIDDYAHHPTEIRATLAAVRNLEPRRLLAIFQPHRYTRTKLLLEEFGNSFDAADYLVITDIYPANELPIKGVTAKLICDLIRRNHPSKKIYYLPKERLVEHIAANMCPGDLVITLGAGDIIKTNDELVERIKGKS